MPPHHSEYCVPSRLRPPEPLNTWKMPGWVCLVERLIEGSHEVLALVETNPFPDHPPRYIRAQLYDYHFTTRAERQASGNWWTRRLVVEYLPTTSLAAGPGN